MELKDTNKMIFDAVERQRKRSMTNRELVNLIAEKMLMISKELQEKLNAEVAKKGFKLEIREFRVNGKKNIPINKSPPKNE